MGDNYYIVQNQDIYKMEESVDKLCKIGWAPVGSPVFVPTPNNVIPSGVWYQALSKSKAKNQEATSYLMASSGTIPSVVPITEPKKNKF